MADQAGLAIFGLLAVWCLGRKDQKARRYGYIFGLCGQPFWYYSTIQNRQWGMLVLTFGYSAIYLSGFCRAWLNLKENR